MSICHFALPVFKFILSTYSKVAYHGEQINKNKTKMRTEPRSIFWLRNWWSENQMD